jgi:zinc protease
VSGARPEPGPPPPYTPRAQHMFALDNGLRGTLVEAGSIPMAAVRLVVRAGSAHVPPGMTWLDRFVHDYLAEGTEDLDSAALADAIASMGGKLSIDSDEHTTVLQTEVLSEHAPNAIALLADVARRPRFDPANELRLLSDLRRNLDLVMTQPQALAYASFRAALYGDHPYGHVLPDPAEVDAMGVETASEFWRTHAHAAGAHLMVAGRFDAASVELTARQTLGDWEPRESAPIARPEPHRGRLLRVTDRPGAEQTTLRIGLPVPDPTHQDYVALEVTNSLLGGSFASRITQNIREQKGYTYSPRSSISARPGDAYWAEAADVTTDVTGAALHEIVAEIERLASETPSEAELAGIQNYVAGSFVIRQATPNSILDSLEFLDLHGLDQSYTATYIDRVRAVTPEDVRRLTSEHLNAAEMTIVAAGDRSAIEEQLAPYGPIEG